jgi:hydrogenase/urease accessory protein HupE
MTVHYSRSSSYLPRSVLPLLAALALVLSLTSTAWAHAVGLSRGAYVVLPNGVRAKLTFSRVDVVSLVPALDSNQDGVVTPAEVKLARPELERVILGGLVVNADGASCTPHLDAANLTEQDGLEIVAFYACPAGARSLHLALKLLDDLSGGHRHVVHAEGASLVDAVLFRGQSELDLPAPRDAGSPVTQPDSAGRDAGDTSGAPQANSADRSWAQFLRMGVEHILTGYDHLVFLFGLVLVGGRLRGIVAVVTAFTLAHSITLALATLGVWAPSPRIVEPAIALSIAYVGVENFFVTTAERRWRITFPFGLIHGFGFAGALREIGLPRAQIPEALVLFNVGVEVGQLSVLALLLPLIYWLRRYSWFRGPGVRWLSAAVVVAGVIWFVERVRG